MSPYRTQSRDTPREVEEVIFEHLRSMTQAERVAEVTPLSRAMFAAVQAGVRLRHPEADDQELFHRTAAHWLGEELARQVYGWDVEKEGW